MKQSLRTRSKPPRRTESERTVTETSQVEAVFGALEDADCREILAATSDESLTANEVSEQCDLALSTAYRKLELLTDAGLLDEQLRLARSGKHTSEYARSIDDIHVSIEGDISLAITDRESEEPTAAILASAD